ncbi:MAG TPA: hypothetical protein VIQ51_08530, partial [Chryseosolibacter sp.]
MDLQKVCGIARFRSKFLKFFTITIHAPTLSSRRIGKLFNGRPIPTLTAALLQPGRSNIVQSNAIDLD